ncbi:MAG: response regulator transcription factor [Nevskia sp.]|nr:response regulator transcription factor [Nevskia sp.]
MRLLLLEAAQPFAGKLGDALRQAGQVVDTFHHPGEGAVALRVADYDLLILDLSASGGLVSVLRDLRARQVHTPALVIAAGGSVSERVSILDQGADDYMAQPVALPELEARIRAVLRRSLAKCGDNILSMGKLQFNLFERSARVDSARLRLSPREIDLLETLMLRRGRVVSKAQIRSRLCDWSGDLSDGAIELYVHRLRRKLTGCGVNLFTVRGFGYLIHPVG